MKRFALILTVVGASAVLSTPAMAADNYAGWGHAAQHHAQTHAELNHRAFDRAWMHHNAHDYGISPWDDARLHRRLNHQAAHDRARHHANHDRAAYAPYRGKLITQICRGTGAIDATTLLQEKTYA